MKKKKPVKKSKLIVFKDANIMVLQKNKEKKRYVLAGGGMKKGESPEACLIREVKEETGAHLLLNDIKHFSSIYAIGDHTKEQTIHYYTLANNGHTFINNEPDNFKSIKWIHYTQALEFLNAYDKIEIKRLFERD